MVNINTKFEVYNYINYEDTKGAAKCRKWGFGWLGVTEGHRQCHRSIERNVAMNDDTHF